MFSVSTHFIQCPVWIVSDEVQMTIVDFGAVTVWWFAGPVKFNLFICVVLALIVCVWAAEMETSLTEWRQVERGQYWKEFDFTNIFFFLWTHSPLWKKRVLPSCFALRVNCLIHSEDLSWGPLCLCLYPVSPSLMLIHKEVGCSVFRKDALIGCGLLWGSNRWIFFLFSFTFPPFPGSRLCDLISTR